MNLIDALDDMWLRTRTHGLAHAVVASPIEGEFGVITVARAKRQRYRILEYSLPMAERAGGAGTAKLSLVRQRAKGVIQHLPKGPLP